MIPSSQIRQYLEEKAERHPRYFSSRLKEGDLVARSLGKDSNNPLAGPKDFYLIDSIDFPTANNVEAFRYINKRIKSKPRVISVIIDFWIVMKYSDIKDDSLQVPFSRAVNFGVGYCLEKSILNQIMQQEREDIFFVLGDYANGGHAFNIAFAEDQPHISDCSVGMSLDGNIETALPYCTPIMGLDEGTYPHGILVDNDMHSVFGKHFIY